MAIVNLKTNRLITLPTAISKGLFSNPENFDLRGQFVNTKTKRFISQKTANQLLRNPDYLPSTDGEIIYDKKLFILNPYTKQILVNNEKNRNKIKNQQALLKGNLVEEKEINTAEDYEKLTPMYDFLNGKNGYFRVVIFRNVIIDNYYVKLDEKTFSKKWASTYGYHYAEDGYWTKPIWSLTEDEAEEVLETNELPTTYFYLYEIEETIAKELKGQSFLDGKNHHCVLSPIRQYYAHMFLEAKGKKTKANYATYLNTINEYLETYKNGVPKDKLQEICDRLNCSFSVKNILQDDYIIVRGQNSRRTFNFVNTRENHLELQETTNHSAKQTFKISREELQKIKQKLDEENKFYLFNYCKKERKNEIASISTIDATYKLEDNTIDEIFEFDKTFGFDKLKMYLPTDSDLLSFLNEGSKTTAHVRFNWIEDLTDLKEFDMKTAYLQYENSPYYQGLPTLINFFGKIDINDITNDDKTDLDMNKVKQYLTDYVGFYSISNINDKNVSENNKKIFNKIGFTEGVYTSPELLFFANIGYTFVIEIGAISMKPMKFDAKQFSMLSPRGYCFWTGLKNRVNDETTYFMNATKSWCQHLRHLYPEKINCFQNCIVNENGETIEDNFTVSITNKKKIVGVSLHIGGFITAYTRVNMFNQLINFDYDNLVGYKLDSIIFKGENKLTSDLFREKPVKVLSKNGTEFFGNRLYNHYPLHINLDNLGVLKLNIMKPVLLCIGAGGNGKTTDRLNDKSYVNVMFSSYAWRLCVDKSSETIDAVSFHSIAGLKVAGKDTIPYHVEHNKYPPVIMIDEITMNSKSDINEAFKQNPYSVFVLAGDITVDNKYFQCSLGQELINAQDFHIIEYNTDYRSKDNEMKKIKIELREIVDKYFNLPSSVVIKSVMNYLTKNFLNRFITEDSLYEMYDINDIILTHTHKRKDHFNALISKKFSVFDDKKYIVVSHNKKDIFKRLSKQEAKLNGEIIISKVQPPKTELCYAMTIHGVQGLTLTNKLIIDLKDCFDINAFYTAISRATKHDQLYFIC